MKPLGVAVEALSLAIGTFRLKQIEFSVSAGEVLVVLGPNGSGKSVMLETIAGFHRPDSGRIFIGGRDVTLLPPEHRRVGFVVQSFGLFPHLTVAANIAIARRRPAGPSRADPADGPFPVGDVAALMKHFEIANLADRLPNALSPGEKQRAALARALAAQPALFLFDEPFSVLDAPTRDHLRGELSRFLRGFAIPAVFVTHDYTDAMTLADRIAILRNGELVQIGTAAEVSRAPATSFVAGYIGYENILAGEVINADVGRATVAVGDKAILVTTPNPLLSSRRHVRLCIRADDVHLRFNAQEDREQSLYTNRFRGKIVGLRAIGPVVTIDVDCGFIVRACILGRDAQTMTPMMGDLVSLEFRADRIHVAGE